MGISGARPRNEPQPLQTRRPGTAHYLRKNFVSRIQVGPDTHFGLGVEDRFGSESLGKIIAGNRLFVPEHLPLRVHGKVYGLGFLLYWLRRRLRHIDLDGVAEQRRSKSLKSAKVER